MSNKDFWLFFFVALVVKIVIWSLIICGALLLVSHFTKANAEELPPWKDAISFCKPLKFNDDNEVNNPTMKMAERFERIYVLCYGPYFLQQMKLSLDYHADLLKTKNELDKEKKKNLVKSSSWPSAWWFVSAGAAILAGGLTGYLLGVRR